MSEENKSIESIFAELKSITPKIPIDLHLDKPLGVAMEIMMQDHADLRSHWFLEASRAKGAQK